MYSIKVKKSKRKGYFSNHPTVICHCVQSAEISTPVHSRQEITSSQVPRNDEDKLNIKPEMQYITILHDIILALQS